MQGDEHRDVQPLGELLNGKRYLIGAIGPDHVGPLPRQEDLAGRKKRNRFCEGAVGLLPVVIVPCAAVDPGGRMRYHDQMNNR